MSSSSSQLLGNDEEEPTGLVDFLDFIGDENCEDPLDPRSSLDKSTTSSISRSSASNSIGLVEVVDIFCSVNNIE